MTKLSKQEQWKQESEKLKAAGFKWRVAGVVDGKKQWQLYTSADEPISKADALAQIEIDEDRKYENVEDPFDLIWEGYYSEAVNEHDDILSMHQEGESYVGFPKDTKVEEEYKDIPHVEGKVRTPWNTRELVKARYTLPDGSVFIFADNMLRAEGE